MKFQFFHHFEFAKDTQLYEKNAEMILMQLRIRSKRSLFPWWWKPSIVISFLWFRFYRGFGVTLNRNIYDSPHSISSAVLWNTDQRFPMLYLDSTSILLPSLGFLRIFQTRTKKEGDKTIFSKFCSKHSVSIDR